VSGDAAGANTVSREETAVVGGGCFWCTEAVFRELQGVRSVLPGYAGGTVPNPSYEQVCAGETGHAECIQIRFDPSEIAYADLLRIFFTVHDPTTKNRQGADVGTQYRSVILYASEEQHRTAEAVLREIGASGIWRRPIVTEIVPLREFYPAEEYHREYFRRNPERSYCQLVIAPKVTEFRRKFASRLVRRGTAADLPRSASPVRA
jgi:peptide-methionine (S)-S-oxide reductase